MKLTLATIGLCLTAGVSATQYTTIYNQALDLCAAAVNDNGKDLVRFRPCNGGADELFTPISGPKLRSKTKGKCISFTSAPDGSNGSTKMVSELSPCFFGEKFSYSGRKELKSEDGKCLTVSDNTLSEGLSKPCNNSPYQKFKLTTPINPGPPPTPSPTNPPTPRAFVVKNPKYDMCIGTPSNDNLFYFDTCSRSQEFTYVNYQLRLKSANTCLGVFSQGGKTASYLRPCNEAGTWRVYGLNALQHSSGGCLSLNDNFNNIATVEDCNDNLVSQQLSTPFKSSARSETQEEKEQVVVDQVPVEKDNTLLFAGIASGAGVLIFATVGALVMRSRRNKSADTQDVANNL